MTPEQFEKVFEKVKNHPDYLETLRRFIKKIAVSGSLTNSRSGSHPAWDKRTVGEEFNFQYGKGLEKSERLEVGPIPVYGSNGIVSFTSQPLTERPSVIVGRKGSAGALNISEGASWTTDVAYYIECPENYDLQFLYILLDSLNLPSFAKGVKPGLSRKDIKGLTINVPPLEEQKRIVAKVSELMALCDDLEEAQGNTATTQRDFVASSLLKLQTDPARTFEELIATNFETFCTNKLDIDKLKEGLISLAIRGKLTNQIEERGLASELVSNLPSPKTAIKNSHLSLLKEFDRDKFEIPNSWVWARLVDLGKTQTGASPSSAKPEYFGSDIPFIKPGDLDGTEIDYDNHGLSKLGVTQSRLAPGGSVLMVCIGATLGKINITTQDICFNQQINSVTPHVASMTKYIAFALRSNFFQEVAWSLAGTGTLPIISKGKWELIPIPIPPLEEQELIVNKLEELFDICDQIEVKLSKENTIKTDLLKTLAA